MLNESNDCLRCPEEIGTALPSRALRVKPREETPGVEVEVGEEADNAERGDRHGAKRAPRFLAICGPQRDNDDGGYCRTSDGVAQ